MNKCYHCQEYLAVEMFRVRKDTGNRRRVCKPCENSSNLARTNAKPDRKESIRNAARKYNLKRYGLTEDDYQQLLEKQEGLCALCDKPSKDINYGRLVVDHCHTTGSIRGLLCSACNLGIGYFQDRPELLKKALRYVGA